MLYHHYEVYMKHIYIYFPLIFFKVNLSFLFNIIYLSLGIKLALFYTLDTIICITFFPLYLPFKIPSMEIAR
jgi:hypothetical protein